MSPQRSDFEEFVATYADTMKALAHTIVGNPQIAEDVTQSALLKMMRHWSDIDHPRAYARRVVISECTDRHRRSQRERPDGGASAERVDERAAQDLDNVLLHDTLWRQVQELPVRQRAVLALRYFEDLADEDIADILGVRAVTVRATASRALAALRRSHDDMDKETVK
ncbi:sigma-70 family RNA polymerase sigma factor [Nocardioides carbamazepini]|uniref:sigma-70 family RNA polymerase sigma factor n=1 Tax=Nocardioides carbamazepini TaxID=2854259 RepID=UPI002149AE48|nr:sigma-70 family RNA polymerase sigma factor [Nocardioides carbamazepini]MCR1785511.1 sigma-70 family RNA polymerase sigma factor [Nocardioides carbamazepini]